MKKQEMNVVSLRIINLYFLGIRVVYLKQFK